MDAIENCKEEVPGHLEANQLVLDGSVREYLARVIATCSQLASRDNYLQHKKDKVHDYEYHLHNCNFFSKPNIVYSISSLKILKLWASCYY